MPRPTPRTAILSIATAAMVFTTGVLSTVVAHASTPLAAPTVTQIANTSLDPAALYFVSYDGIVNNASYQQNGIITWSGYQYAAWYTATRNAVLARRALSSTSWEKVTLAHTLSVNDSHNSISLGVSPADGRLHVAMDTHDSGVST